MYNMNQQRSLVDRITRARTQCMRHEQFIAMAGLLMVGTWEVCDKTSTAYTNGKKVVYGRAFCEPLTDGQLRWLILHEYFHVMLKHMIVWKHLWEEDGELANIAADIVINNWLDNVAGPKHGGFLEMPPGGALDHQYDGLDTGEVYRKLRQQGQKGQGGGGSGGQGQGKGKGKPQAGGFDEHDFKGKGDGEGEGDEGDDGDGSGGLSAKELEALGKMVDEAMRQGAQTAGRMGGNVSREFTTLLEVTVPWEEQLRDFISCNVKGNDMSTWRRPSRRWMSRDVYMPSHINETMAHMVCAMDLSGSISQDTHNRFMTEIMGAVGAVLPQRMDIVYWDDGVRAHEVYEDDEVLRCNELTKPKGGGGTRIGCVKEFLNKENIKPDCIIVLTDGYVEQDWGGANDWPAPVLFCITTKDMTAPFGKSLFIPEN